MIDNPQGFEPIGLGLRPNDGTGDAPRVVGDKLNRMLRGVFARLEASEAALEDAQAVIAELLAGGGVTPTPTPTPTPSFTVLPAIVTDGTPIVGELATFDFGTISGGVAGGRRLVTSAGVDVADASSGAFQWTVAGEFKLRVTIVGTAITAESAVVTVLAESLGDFDPGSPGETTIAFPADRAAGANPVTLLSQTASSAPGDGLQIRAGHGASFNAIAWMDWLDAVISPGDEDNEVRSFTVDQELIAGRTWFQGRATRAKDTNNNAIPVRYGPASNIVDDTLEAAGGTPAPTPTPTPTPPASVAFDPATSDSRVTLTHNNRTAQQNVNQSDMVAWTDFAGKVGSELALTFNEFVPPAIYIHTSRPLYSEEQPYAYMLDSGGYNANAQGEGVGGANFAASDTVKLKLRASSGDPTKYVLQFQRNGNEPVDLDLIGSAPLYVGLKFQYQPDSVATISDHTHWTQP